MNIGYGRQEITQADIDAVVETLKSDFLTQGPKINEFEDLVAKYHNADYGVAFTNGTAALHACYYVLGVREGDEVICPAITFAASMNGALYEHATPVFCDIDINTNCMSIDNMRDKMTNKTKVVTPVSFAGYPYDLKSLRDLLGNEIAIVHDAAHAIGSKRDGSFGMEYADLAILSFHPVKHITTGEGGMVLTNNKQLYNKLVEFRTHGITKDPQKFSGKNPGSWYHEMQTLGYNYRMCDIVASLGISQFTRINDNIYKRNAIAKKYNEQLEQLDWLEIPPQFDLSWLNGSKTSNTIHSYHLYTVRIKNGRRREFFEFLHSKQIFAQVHYIPVNAHPYYMDNFGTSINDHPLAKSYYEETVSLPMFHSMTDDEFSYIIDMIKQFGASL